MLNTFKYIDAAQSLTSDDMRDIANRQWSNEDRLVSIILERIPTKYHEKYLERVTRPNF